MLRRVPAFALALAVLLILPAMLVAQAPASQGAGLKIVVIEGEDGVNIIEKKTAVQSIVEVRDKNDLPVAGAPVTLSMSSGGTFSNGLRQLTLMTDSTGRATVAGINPAGAGQVQLQVSTTYQGQTATATIHQTNFVKVADAIKAGKPPAGQSSGASSGGSGSAGAGSGAAAGGGLSHAALIGIGAAAAGGTVAAVAVSKRNHAPTLTTVSASPSTVLAASNTPISFTAQGSDADNDPLTYTWDFGDGASGSGATTTHAYTATSAQTFTAKATVSDGKDSSAPQQATITLKTLDGTWRASNVGAGWQVTLTLSQSGAGVSGSLQIVGTNSTTQGSGTFTGTVSTGAVRTASPRVSLTAPAPRSATSSWVSAITFALDPSSDVNSLTGTTSDSTGGAPSTFARQ